MVRLNYYLKVLPEVKFTRKNLYDTCLANPLLARAMSFTARLSMTSEVLIGALPPDLDTFASKYSFEDRVSWIVSFSEPYPGYENDHIHLPIAIEETALIGQRNIIANDMWFDTLGGNFILDESYMYEAFMTQEEGEPKYVPGQFAFATPFGAVTHEEEGDYIFPSEEE